MIRDSSQEPSRQPHGFFLSIGDLMAALLMVVILFLVVALSQMQRSEQQAIAERERAETVAEALAATQVEVQRLAQRYVDTRQQIYLALMDEFARDQERWKAEIIPETLSIRFNEEVAFERNSAALRPQFAVLLNDFFPRYVAVLYPRFADAISDVLIEGHTANPGQAFDFVSSMNLANQRSVVVLNHVLRTNPVWLSQLDRQAVTWLERRVGANGYSHGRPVTAGDGRFDWDSSRRVEFRVLTDAGASIQEIRQIVGDGGAR